MACSCVCYCGTYRGFGPRASSLIESVREVLPCTHIGKEVLTETSSFWTVLFQHRRV